MDLSNEPLAFELLYSVDRVELAEEEVEGAKSPMIDCGAINPAAVVQCSLDQLGARQLLFECNFGE